jgi:hypothetical protein
MKFLKYLLYILLGLIIIFFATGFIVPKVNYGHKISVNKSVKEAWAVTQDESKYDQWLEGFKSMELISGEYGAVGSKYKIIVNPGEGQEDFEMIETVVSIKEFEEIYSQYDSDMMDFEQTMLFDEADGISTVETKSTVMAKSAMMRSMFALMEILGGAFQSQEEKNIEALKKLIEENTTDYYPTPKLIESDTILQEELNQ